MKGFLSSPLLSPPLPFLFQDIPLGRFEMEEYIQIIFGIQTHPTFSVFNFTGD
jgi:hypothetical protein